MIRVLIVDDDGIVREGLSKNINWAANGCEVVGSAANGREGLRLARECRPDVVLTDIRMPLMDGIGLADVIAHELQPTKVVILSGFNDFSYARKAMNAKVSDFVLKWQDNSEVVTAVLKAAQEVQLERASMAETANARSLAMEARFRALLTGSEYDQTAPGAAGSFATDATFACLALGLRENGDRARVKTVKTIAGERAGRLDLANVSVDFGDSLALVFACPPAKSEQPALLAIDLVQTLKIRYPTEQEALVLYQAPVVALSSLGLLWNTLREALGTALIAGRKGALELNSMREYENSSAALFRRMKDRVDRDYQDENLSLPDMALQANVVATYASTLFKRFQGVGFLEYLTTVRIRAACRLLAGTDLPVGDVAAHVGMPNQRYFSSVFRKSVGVNPLQYRQEQVRNESK